MKNSRNPVEILEDKKNSVGDSIKECRLKKDMSSQELSNKLMILGIDMHRESIYAIENGSRTVTDYELAAIAYILETTTDNLLKKFYKKLKNITN